MEWNGMKYNVELSMQLAEHVKQQLQEIKDELDAIYPGTPINWNSTDQVSAFLYGGSIKHEYKYEDGVYKTGARAGQPKLRWATEYFDLPQLVKPLRGSELAKEGFYATDQGTLRQLRANKKVRRYIELILKQSELEKLIGTYYEGLPKMVGMDGIIHGRFNQCVAATGRLSSSDPNLQNFDGRVDVCLVSRY
jgi:DNA polymerase I-like protein with 3'-5' exonuclease and polymerase domains